MNNFHAKITNLELSGFYGFDKTIIGCPAWAAPELLCGNAEYTPLVDVYSFSMLMVEIMNEKKPYTENNTIFNTRELLNDIATKAFRPTRLDRSRWPRKLLHLLDSCCQVNANDRPTFIEIVEILQNISDN